MHIFEKKKSWQSSLAKTGFFVSLISYITFFLADLLRPGFVSRSFSVHLLLIVTVAFAAWWMIILGKEKDRIFWQYLAMIPLGLALAVLTWKSGQGFGQMRLLITVLAVIIPLITLQIARKA